MVTPELQKYISQSRTSGMTDEQIRAALASQGWEKLDIDQSLGLSPVSSGPTSTAANSKATKLAIVIIIIFVVLPMLFWMGIAGFGYWKYKSVERAEWNEYGGQFNPDNEQTNNNLASNVKLCGDWPGNHTDNVSSMARASERGSKNPLPNYVPIYPNGKIVASMRGGMGAASSMFNISDAFKEGIGLILCTDDSVRQVTEYYDNQAGGQPEKDGMVYYDIKEMSQQMSYGMGTEASPINIWQGQIPDEATYLGQGAIVLKMSSSQGYEYMSEGVLITTFDYKGETIIQLLYGKY